MDGKIEPGETPLDAMRREFMEEAGVFISKWHLFRSECYSRGSGATVHFFATFNSEAVKQVRTQTDELVLAFPTQYVVEGANQSTLYNIPYLVMMALTYHRQPPENIPNP